ncbi:MAG: hypothetical protein NUV77_20530 [Thermoguttaceae bacterium]|jgi:hypothetical protein|nr:hypothetical protein [Thermoguttaceae bacterium]
MDQNLPLLPLIVDEAPDGVRQVLAREGIPWRERTLGSAEGRFVLFDSSRARPGVGPGQVPIDLARLREILPEDPFVALADRQTARFRWNIGGYALARRLPRHDARGLRRQIVEFLRAKVEQAGGVWIRVAPFPFPYRSALNVRIDHDLCHAADLERLFEAIADDRGAVTHCLGAAALGAMAPVLSRPGPLDVGFLGLRHHLYWTAQENRANIQHGLAALQAAGFSPSGFGMPEGASCCRLEPVLESLGVSYASGLGPAYDELPATATTGRLLHMPVHPVTLTMFLRAACQGSTARWSPGASDPDQADTAALESAVDAATAYFAGLVEERSRLGEPLLLYDRAAGCLGRYPRVLRAVFDTAGRLAIWKTTLAGLADWWRARGQTRISVVRRDGRLVVIAEQRPRAYRVGIEYCRGRHVALLPLDDRVLEFSPEALVYENRKDLGSVRPVRVDPPETPIAPGHLHLSDSREADGTAQTAFRPWHHWARRAIRRWVG